MGADEGDTDAQQDHYREHRRQEHIVPEGLHIRQPGLGRENDPDDRRRRDDPADRSVNDGAAIHGPGDKPAGGADHLHGLDQKAVAEHGQPDRIVDEDDDGYRDHEGNDQQDQAGLSDPVIHVGYQFFVVFDLVDTNILGEVGFYLVEGVGIRMCTPAVQVHGGRQWILLEDRHEVIVTVAHELLPGHFLGDIFVASDIGPSGDKLHQGSAVLWREV